MGVGDEGEQVRLGVESAGWDWRGCRRRRVHCDVGGSFKKRKRWLGTRCSLFLGSPSKVAMVIEREISLPQQAFLA